ncbi:MAG TPA: hypothetical protein VMT53_23485 [Terriglobales bacterium]|nr:hypothetical protein [Terriglobales bacterium]
MNLTAILEELRGRQNDVTEDDIRRAFGDYHNLLSWLAAFLTADEKRKDAYIVDACTIAETQTQDFHEWLILWAARATIQHALQEQHAVIAELASKYERSEPGHLRHAPLSRENFLFLIKNAEVLRSCFDPLCRFVLVLNGIAKSSFDEAAAQLGTSPSAVERAYSAACDSLEHAVREPCIAGASPSLINKQGSLARPGLCEG